MAKRKTLAPIIYQIYSMEEIARRMASALVSAHSFHLGPKNIYHVQMSKPRLRTHLFKDFTCECCGLKANKYEVRRNPREEENSIHLDLFWYGDGTKIMFHSLSVREKGDLLCGLCFKKRRDKEKQDERL